MIMKCSGFAIIVTVLFYQKTSSAEQCSIPGQVYTTCGSACNTTCANYNTPPICTAQCVQRCECPNNTVLDQKAMRCVDREECRSFEQKYPFSLELSPDNYYLFWNFSKVDETIQFAVRVKTEGWVGFGVSPNGQMPGSDVVIGWVDGDKTYFNDRFAERRALPPIDEMQDWFLVSGAINDGYTELEFTRNYTTCDNESKDLDIRVDTSRVIYSWNNNKPTVTRNGDQVVYSNINFHQQQGSASVNLLGGLPNPPQIPDNASTFKVNATNVEIPGDVDTTYWCAALSIEDLIEDFTNTKYIVKFGPSITESSAQYVHHILVYTCDTVQESDLHQGGPCHVLNENITDCRGGGGILIAAWAVGGNAFLYPDNVAYPIGGPSGHRYFVIEMHYNNPGLVSGVVDSSGIEFTYLNEPRQHDAGILQFGHLVTRRMIIPPRASNYTIPGYCTSNCTQTYLPSGGIRIFGNMLHTHVAGTGLSFSIVRKNGSVYEEVKPIERNLRYDFNFQQATSLPNEIEVLPGDGILLNCFYNASSRSTTILGGESTSEEMCLSFPIYYPRIDMTGCLSYPLFDQLEDFIRTKLPLHEQQFFVPLLNGFSVSALINGLNQVEWNNALADDFEEAIYINGNQQSFCYSPTDALYLETLVPRISRYYTSPAPVRNCSVTETDAAGTTIINCSLLMILAMIVVGLFA